MGHPKPHPRSFAAPRPEYDPHVRVRRPSSRRPSVRKVLVATDRSASADRAVAWAAELAERYGAELVVLQVVADGTGEAERELAAFASRVTEAPARALVVEDSDPSAAIVRVGRQEAVDTIVVGNVGMSGRREFLLGNVPNRVSHNAPCTVVIVDTSAGARRR